MIIILIVAVLFRLPALLERSFPPLHFTPLIIHYAQGAQIDPALVAAVIKVESAFRKEAVSSKGARGGLMQLMPETAAWLAEGKNGGAAAKIDLFEPEVNIALGVQYLQYLLDLFPTEYAALAAYNGGPSHVKRWLNQGIWDGSWAASQQIPPFGETRSYVRKVELMRRIYRFLYQAQLEYGKEPGHEQTD